jgi:hypothetical protein
MEIKNIKPIIYLQRIYEDVLIQDFLKINFGDENILIVSDYSGDRKEDNFYVHSFLITNIPEGAMHISRMYAFRDSNPDLPNNSFFEFKSIKKDKLRKRLLPEFLTISDKLDGLLVVFLEEKQCKWLGNLDGEISKKLKGMNLGDWKSHISRKMLTTFILGAFLASKIPRRDRNLIWISDRDSRIGDNESQQFYSMEIFKIVFNLFDTEFKNINRYTQHNKAPDEDLNSVVDVAAGFLLDILDKGVKHSFSSDYAKWFFLEQGKLRKRCIKIFEESGIMKIHEIVKKAIYVP